MPQTITISKTNYDILKNQASLYQEFLQAAPEKNFGVELYSKKRIKEFFKQDKISKQARLRLQSILKSVK